MEHMEDPDEHEQNVYGDSARESLMEDGEISAEEDAFMQGYENTETEEEETGPDAYEQAFATRRRRKKQEEFDTESLEEEYEG